MVLASAYAFGAWWLGGSLLGLPVWLWALVGMLALWGRVRETAGAPLVRRWRALVERGEVWERGMRSRSALQPSGRLIDRAGGLFARIGAGAVGVIRRSVGSSDRFGGRFGDFGKRLAGQHDRLPWPTAAVRIGIDLPWSCAEAITSAEGEARIEWVPLRDAMDADRAISELRLDALVRQSDGPLHIVTPEDPEREAGWHDWSHAVPFSFASVFPPRIDPFMVSLPGQEIDYSKSAQLIRLLAEAAALLSRTPVRIGIEDRLRGRRPVQLPQVRWTGPTEMSDHTRSLIAVMERLAERVASREPGEDSPALRAAARASSAWFAAASINQDADLRLRCIESARRLLKSEPEHALRAVAAHVANYDDVSALEAAVHAERIVRIDRRLDTRTLAFLQSEIDCGLAGPMTVGRIAAGICMACAVSSNERLQFFRDDLAEDLRYAGWMLGREGDERFLLEVVRRIELARGVKRVYEMPEEARAAA